VIAEDPPTAQSGYACVLVAGPHSMSR